MNVIGEVKGQHCLIVDDMIDTAGTLVKGAEALLEKGAASVRPARRMRCSRVRRWSGLRNRG